MQTKMIETAHKKEYLRLWLHEEAEIVVISKIAVE